MSGALVVFAKQPVPGRVKTRLCPPFTAEQAASFYAAMLDDVLEVSQRAAQELGLAAVLAVHPAESCAGFRARAPAYRVLAQRGVDLAERLDDAVARLAAEGVTPLLVRGSDSPLLDAALLAEAVATLQHSDLVLCPDPDGGYSLIGLGKPAPGLLRHPMSTANVLRDTLSGARALGLRTVLLPARFDIDVVEDLHLLQRSRQKATRQAAHARSPGWTSRPCGPRAELRGIANTLPFFPRPPVGNAPLRFRPATWASRGPQKLVFGLADREVMVYLGVHLPGLRGIPPRSEKESRGRIQICR